MRRVFEIILFALLAISLMACSPRGVVPNQMPASTISSATEGPALPPTKPLATPTVSSNPTAAAVSSPTATQGLSRGQIAPDFTLKDLQGNSHSLSDFRGKVVMLNFWASWCGFCRSEIPAMNKVYAELADQGFEIVAVNLGEDPEHLKQFAQENHMAFPILPDINGEVITTYKIQSIPQSYFLDREGVIREIYLGAIPEEILRAIVTSLLEKQ